MTVPPDIGFGTFKLTDSDECVQSVRQALEIGYRFIDTAQLYENEEHVGRGIAESSVPREEVTLASKVDKDNLGYSDVIETTEASRRRLGVDVIDVMYVHWPEVTYEAEETIPAFDELVDRGTIREIGVSNFTPDLIDEARDIAGNPITTVQVEMHPLLQQEELVEYVRKHDMYLVAYAPLAKGRVFDVPVISDIAEKHGATEIQVTLAWFLRKENVVPIPKARGDHIKENYRAVDLELSEEDVRRIDEIEDERRLVHADTGPWTW